MDLSEKLHAHLVEPKYIRERRALLDETRVRREEVLQRVGRINASLNKHRKELFRLKHENNRIRQIKERLEFLGSQNIFYQEAVRKFPGEDIPLRIEEPAYVPGPKYFTQ